MLTLLIDFDVIENVSFCTTFSIFHFRLLISRIESIQIFFLSLNVSVRLWLPHKIKIENRVTYKTIKSHAIEFHPNVKRFLKLCLMFYSKHKTVNRLLRQLFLIKRNLHSKHTSYHIIDNEYLNIFLTRLLLRWAFIL